MERSVFLNGEVVPFAEARIPIMDRGFLFADGVYEVGAVLDGGLVDNAAHLARLDRSLAEIAVVNPYSDREWRHHQCGLVRRNGLEQGVVYIQVTRGVAERDFAYPSDLPPTVLMFTQARNLLDSPLARNGAAVVTLPDIRWGRRDIKSIGLLAQVMAKRGAAEVGAAEAFMVEDGIITEGASSSVFLVTRDDVIVTRPLSRALLPGITRLAVMGLAEQHGLALQERAFTVDEACAAAEVFFTSASNFVVPVVSIDRRPIGTGRPGPRSAELRELYVAAARADARLMAQVRSGE